MLKKLDTWMREHHNDVWLPILLAVLMGIPVTVAQVTGNTGLQEAMFWVTSVMVVLCYVFLLCAAWATAREGRYLGAGYKADRTAD